MSLRTFHFRPCPFITRLELKGFQRRTPTFLPAESPLPLPCLGGCHGAAAPPAPRACAGPMAQLLLPPWCGCTEVEAGTWLGGAPWEENPRKGQQSIHGSSTVVGILSVLRCPSVVCPWCGTGRGKFGPSLPQRSPKSKVTLYPEGWWLSQISPLTLHKGCLNGIVSGAACRALLGVLVPIKIPVPIGIIGILTPGCLLKETL